MMKRISIALMTFAAALAAVSCQKEAELQEQSLGQMTITAVPEQVTTPDLTKAEMAYKYDVLWQTDDEILVRKESEKSTKATFKLKTGEGTTKGIFSCDESPFQPGDGVEAFYPASLVEESKLTWPAIQENNQVAPMFCKKNITTDTEEFNFKSLGAVMQIVLSTPMKGITLKSISIKDGTKAMSGEFEVGSDDQAVITDTDLAGITLDLGEGVAIGEAAKYFNIAVPAGKYENLTLTFTATDGSKCVMTSTTMPEIKRNVVGKLTISAPQFTGGTNPTGALEGVFSVAEGRTVHFSQGNLWYGPVTEGAPATFNFEANQYDSTPFTNGNRNPDHVSHFSWSKDASVACAENYSDDSAAIGDVLFTNADETTAKSDFTVNGQTGMYRTLSEAEWYYLINTRTVNGGTGKNKSYSLNITYGGMKGLVLYPDSYSGEPISSTVEELPKGVVFLPMAGSLGARNLIQNIGRSGYYWSSRAHMTGKQYAYPGLNFNTSSCTAGDSNDGRRLSRSSGYSVRLVTETINHLPLVAVESVTLDKTEMIVPAKKTNTLTATIAPVNATNKQAIWTSDNTSVAKVYTLNGNVYVEGIAEGTATITAIVDASHTASCTVTVFMPVSKVTLDKTRLTLIIGDSDEKLTATVAPENATDKTVSWNSDNTDVATVDDQGNVHAVAAGTANIKVTTTDGGKTATCAVTVRATRPADPLPGVFTVADDGAGNVKKVKFSKGNLQATYNSSTGTYFLDFAANQHDYIGNAAGNTTIGSPADGAVVDLFGWSTASTTYGISASTDVSIYSGDFVDWGKAIDNKGTWTTLTGKTNGEWKYLFDHHVYVLGTCNNVAGIFIAPDGFEGDATTLSTTVSDWQNAEAAGVVFLPAAGNRNGKEVLAVGTYGNYWSSSTISSQYAARATFSSNGVTISDNPYSKSYGHSVRLVTEVK